MSTIEEIKIIIRERDIPFFDDSEIEFYLKKNNNDFDKTVYDLLIQKSENTKTSLNGMTVEDSSSYFTRLAENYRPHNSRILK
jgi:uncharacterized membrane protein